MPKPVSRSPKPDPIAVTIRVAARKFFLQLQIIERATRPPSSGNAGTRLNTTRIALIQPR